MATWRQELKLQKYPSLSQTQARLKMPDKGWVNCELIDWNCQIVLFIFVNRERQIGSQIEPINHYIVISIKSFKLNLTITSWVWCGTETNEFKLNRPRFQLYCLLGLIEGETWSKPTCGSLNGGSHFVLCIETTNRQSAKGHGPHPPLICFSCLWFLQISN